MIYIIAFIALLLTAVAVFGSIQAMLWVLSVTVVGFLVLAIWLANYRGQG